MRTMAPSALERVAVACVHECVRQDVGIEGVARLLTAYAYAVAHGDRAPAEADVLELARLVDPVAGRAYRRVPVTFLGGTTAPGPADVPGAMERLFANFTRADDGVDELVRGFLAIHPFADGNGRTAFVLRNWLRARSTTPPSYPAGSRPDAGRYDPALDALDRAAGDRRAPGWGRCRGAGHWRVRGRAD